MQNKPKKVYSDASRSYKGTTEIRRKTDAQKHLFVFYPLNLKTANLALNFRKKMHQPNAKDDDANHALLLLSCSPANRLI